MRTQRQGIAATRARFDLVESETRSSFFSWSHFLRKTGVHFSGKCSRCSALIAASTITAGLLAASPVAAQEHPSAPLKVIASFSILGDFAGNVGGERLQVATLVGPNGNAHVYAPSPADAKKVADARLVFVNGLGFEGWLDRLVKASGTTAAIIVATKGIKPLERADAHDHDHGRADPHAWQSVANAKIYVGNIRDALIAIDPAGKAHYESSAAAYLARLDALDREVRDTIAKVPADRRRVVTSHNAFGYFESAYGIKFTAPQGVSTEAEASAKDVASIISAIRKQKASAVFLENVTDPRLVRQIASETGAKVGGVLYSDALTDEKADATTYIDLIRHNLKQLANALTS
jgi:zinc/manganese transport system substrate-binding protein